MSHFASFPGQFSGLNISSNKFEMKRGFLFAANARLFATNTTALFFVFCPSPHKSISCFVRKVLNELKRGMFFF